MSENVLKGQVTLEEILPKVKVSPLTLKRECVALADVELRLSVKIDKTQAELEKLTSGKHVSGTGAKLVRRLDALENAHASVANALEVLRKLKDYDS